MSERTVRHFVEGLLRGRRTERARPDDFEAAQMAAAIEMRAARMGSDSPSEQFLTDLHRRLAEQMNDDLPPSTVRRGPLGTRRQVVVGTGVAAASAAAGIVVGRNLLASKPDTGQANSPAQGTLAPNAGAWRAVGAVADLPTGGALAFDLGSVTGFVGLSAGIVLARVNAFEIGCGVMILDAPEGRLRCPCHSTSFSLEGQTLTHQLPTVPPPLPKIEVGERNGFIEVLAPTEPA